MSNVEDDGTVVSNVEIIVVNKSVDDCGKTDDDNTDDDINLDTVDSTLEEHLDVVPVIK